MKNFGVLPGRRPTDFVAGTLPYEVRNQSGNWDSFVPLGEWQRNNFVDTMACVTFSLLNCIETQEFYLTGQRINYSDRWIAMMSGTTPQGNYLYAVADAVRKYGLVKEESWPAPANYTWDSYYAHPDAQKQAQLEAEGQEWLKTHNFAYEWLTTNLDDILKHLKQCPLQIVKPGHAIEGFYQVQQVTNYFDSYDPFKKQLQRSELTDVLKPLLTINNMQEIELVNSNGTFYLTAKGKVIHGYGDISLIQPFLNAGIEPVNRVVSDDSEAITFDIGFYGHSK